MPVRELRAIVGGDPAGMHHAQPHGAVCHLQFVAQGLGKTAHGDILNPKQSIFLPTFAGGFALLGAVFAER